MPNLPYRLPSTDLTRAYGVTPTVIGGFALSIVVASSWATQEAAYWLGYGPELGVPIVGRIYNPFSFFWWLLQFHGQSHAMWQAVTTFFEWLGFGIALTLVRAFYQSKQYGQASGLRGSATLGEREGLEENGMLKPRGVFCGVFEDEDGVAYVWDSTPAPVYLEGANRQGKGHSFVIPNLLLWGDSTVVLDPKGENWERTSGYLKSQGHMVLRINPMDDNATPWDALLEMPEYPYDVGFAQNLAQALKPTLERNQMTGDPHWELTAIAFVAAVALHVFYAEEEKSMRQCWFVMVDPTRSVEDILQRLETAEHDPTGKYGWTHPITGQPTKTHPNVIMAAAEMKKRTAGDKTSVVSTANAYFGAFRDPVVANNTKESGFRVEDLFDEALPPVTVYLTVTLDEQGRLGQYLRLFFYQLWRVAANRQVPRSVGWGLTTQGPRQLLLLLDEFAVLGNMEPFTRVFSNLASLGVKVALIVQAFAQIRGAYGEDTSKVLFKNCTTKLAFRAEGQDDAKHISFMCGTQTVLVPKRSYTGHRWSPWLGHVIASEEQEERDILKPSEAMRLPDEQMILFVKGVPYLLRKAPYFQDVELARRAEIPAPPTSDWTQGGGFQWDPTGNTAGTTPPGLGWQLNP